jgi:tetratricopeptide (TPR) repeat protein
VRILLLLLLALFAGAAFGQPASQPVPREKAKLFYQAGEAYYQAGEYQKALDAYEEAATLVDAPELLFNMAQCYRLLGQKEEALESYRRFLAEVPNTPYRKEIEGRIRLLEATPPPSASAPLAALVPPEPLTPQRSRFLLPGGLAVAGAALGLVSVTLYLDLKNEARPDEAGLRRRVDQLAIAADLSFLAAGITLLVALRQQAP